MLLLDNFLCSRVEKSRLQRELTMIKLTIEDLLRVRNWSALQANKHLMQTCQEQQKQKTEKKEKLTALPTVFAMKMLD